MHRSEESNKRTKYNFSEEKEGLINEEEPEEKERLFNEEGSEEGSEEGEPEEESEEDPISDLSINHHPQRKGLYHMVEQNKAESDEESDRCTDTNSTWIIDDINLSDVCKKYTEFCFSKNNPQKLNDLSILAINNIYLFSETLQTSITRYFGCNNQHHQIIRNLGIYDEYSTPSSLVYEWCTKCIICPSGNWREIQKLTIGFLNKALDSTNDMDLIVANVLHRILPSLKIVGYVDQRGEDSFVHDVLAPLLDIIFSFDPNLNHFWANISLNEVYKEYKPDFGVYVNGLSKRFVVLVAEFKPVESKQRQESDLVKIGKQMRIMLNELLAIGVKDPVSSGILVSRDTMYTFKMHLAGENLYVMTQLSAIQVVKTHDDLTCIPIIVSKLVQIKGISINTAEKVQSQAMKVRDGNEIVRSSIPLSWLSTRFYSLKRKNL
ncbi:hypothetical protein BDF21DRAFT_420200 [Thamnidium elegans]|nr:hypothetical protein BDF21DRAFT_420200 [Thamnidium elegans]